MNVQEVKSILAAVREAERHYRTARDKCNAWRQDLYGGRTPRITGGDYCAEHSGNIVEDAYIKLIEYAAAEDAALRQLITARRKAEQLISALTDSKQREVITRRYIIGQRWEDIAESMHYSRQHVTRLHGYALQNMCLNVTFSL